MGFIFLTQIEEKKRSCKQWYFPQILLVSTRKENTTEVLFGKYAQGPVQNVSRNLKIT